MNAPSRFGTSGPCVLAHHDVETAKELQRDPPVHASGRVREGGGAPVLHIREFYNRGRDNYRFVKTRRTSGDQRIGFVTPSTS